MYSRTRHRVPRARTTAPSGSSPRVDRCSTSPSGNRRVRIGVVGIYAAYIGADGGTCCVPSTGSTYAVGTGLPAIRVTRQSSPLRRTFSPITGNARRVRSYWIKRAFAGLRHLLSFLPDTCPRPPRSKHAWSWHQEAHRESSACSPRAAAEPTSPSRRPGADGVGAPTAAGWRRNAVRKLGPTPRYPRSLEGAGYDFAFAAVRAERGAVAVARGPQPRHDEPPFDPQELDLAKRP